MTMGKFLSNIDPRSRPKSLLLRFWSFVTVSNRPAEEVTEAVKRLKAGGDFLLSRFAAMIHGSRTEE
jgi:hypothetical protein